MRRERSRLTRSPGASSPRFVHRSVSGPDLEGARCGVLGHGGQASPVDRDALTRREFARERRRDRQRPTGTVGGRMCTVPSASTRPVNMGKDKPVSEEIRRHGPGHATVVRGRCHAGVGPRRSRSSSTPASATAARDAQAVAKRTIGGHSPRRAGTGPTPGRSRGSKPPARPAR